MDEGHFRPDVDVDLFVFEFNGIEMAYHHQLKFLQAASRTRTCPRRIRTFAGSKPRTFSIN